LNKNYSKKKRFVQIDERVQTGESRTRIKEQSKASICAYKTQTFLFIF